MRYTVTIEATDAGDYVASCEELGATARCLSPACALDRLREEMQYCMEWCPCLSVDVNSIEFEVTRSV
jgi:predicted RNase H-like HicB family nuclease